MDFENLRKYGITDSFIKEASVFPEYTIGRVISQNRNLYKIVTESTILTSEVSGNSIHNATDLSDFPIVGDFVLSDRTDNSSGNAIIKKILTRKSELGRKVAGARIDKQLIASNIDIIFICMSLNNDFNIRRIERYLAVAWDSGAVPVIILTKSDLCEDLDERLSEVYSVAIGVDTITTSSLEILGFEELSKYIKPEQTIAFIGSSGVGKSTLINTLAGTELMKTNDLRNDDKGKHTTTSRELFVLPNGGIVVDTPGIREISFDNTNISKAFADVEDFASQCKFSDCSHLKEPGCAIQKAIEDGTLTQERFNSYLKLKKEAKYDGLTSKQIETKKIQNMFGSSSSMKKFKRHMKDNKLKKYIKK